MLDWTDRHCRYFHRLLAPRARLYTEMVTTGAVLHGDAARHLDFDEAEHPVALQLGGSEPADLAEAARLGFKRAVVPYSAPQGVEGIDLIRVGTLPDAIDRLGLVRT